MNPEKPFYGWGLPVQASTFAVKIDWALYVLHGVMIAIFALWSIYMVYCLIHYRKKEGVKAIYGHHTPLSSYIPDAVILAFDIWLIFIVGIPIWAHIREDLPKPENATEVSVVGEQFSWNIHYPGADGKFGRRDISLTGASNPLGLDENDPDGKDDIAVINELHVPMGKPVLVHLSSKDVIHSFFVPAFRSKQDAVPGMKVSIWFEPKLTGKFEISCAQLCGLAHYRMRGDVVVETPEEFAAWTAQKLKEKG